MDYKKAYTEAKANGYSDTEIAQYLGGDNYEEAKKSGYSDQDIISHLAGIEAPSVATQPIATPSPQETSPKFYELEKQPGLPRSPMDLLKQAARQFVEGATSPMPGSMLALPARVVQENAQQMGAEVARGASTPGGMIPDLGKTKARLLGLATSIATDPTTFMGAGEGAQIAKDVTKAGVAKVAPTAMKVLADVPEEATNVLLKTEDLFTKATGSTSAIETAVNNVQEALKSTLKKEGAAIGAVEEKLGIAKTPEILRQEMMVGKGVGGYMQEIQRMSPSDLLIHYEKEKPLMNRLTPGQKIGYLHALQTEINGRISNFKMVGDPMEGLLKSTGKDIAQDIKTTPGGELIRAVQAKYARARNLYDGLKKLLKDEGQSEQILQNVFNSQAPRYKSIRRGLAELEKISGQPVLTNLFQEFAAKSLNRLVGKGSRATAGVTLMGSGAMTAPFHPIAGAGQMVVGATLAASQSPKLLSKLVELAPKAAQLPGAVAGTSSAVAAQRGNSKVNLAKIREFLLRKGM